MATHSIADFQTSIHNLAAALLRLQWTDPVFQLLEDDRKNCRRADRSSSKQDSMRREILMPKDPFWELWMQFREQSIDNYERDFASWITSSPSPVGISGCLRRTSIPIRFLPIFSLKQKDGLRLRTSASPIVYGFHFSSRLVRCNRVQHIRWPQVTGEPERPRCSNNVVSSGGKLGNIGIQPVHAGRDRRVSREANPAPTCPITWANFEALCAWRPHVIVPFAWTDIPSQKSLDIQNSTLRPR